MTDRSKFEQMLEYLISEDQAKAKEIFHQLVVEKSREIYENILAEEFSDEDEYMENDDEESDELEGDEDSGEVGGDATDDFLNDIEADDEEDMDSDEGDIEDRVMDLEDALDELRAEFEQQLSGEGSDKSDMDLDTELGSEEDDKFGGEFGPEEDDEELKDSFDMSDNFMREYIEKVTGGHGAEKKAKGDNGDNVKSVIDNMKNDMGGTAANIAAGGEMGGKGVQSGLLKPNVKEIASGNINVPGAKAGKTAFKKREPGHGAERKGSGDMGDKTAKSPLNGLTRRAK